MNERRPFQFGIRRLILLTSVLAATLALVARLNVPTPIRVVVACYVGLLATWFVIRGPAVYRNLARASEQRKRIRDQRDSMMR